MNYWRFLLLVVLIAVMLAAPFAFAEGSAPDGTQSVKDWIMLFFNFDYTNILLVTVAGYAFMLVVYWQINRNDGFDMRAMLARAEANGQWIVEPGRVFQTGAFLVTTWAFITLVSRDKLTTEMALGYIVLWAGSRALNQITASKFPVAPGTSIIDQPSAPSSVVTTTTTEVKP